MRGVGKGSSIGSKTEESILNYLRRSSLDCGRGKKGRRTYRPFSVQRHESIQVWEMSRLIPKAILMRIEAEVSALPRGKGGGGGRGAERRKTVKKLVAGYGEPEKGVKDGEG